MLSHPQTNNINWQWKHWEGLSYLTCELLENWHHGFFTQQFSPRLPEELIGVLNPEANAYRVKQVHGNRLLMPLEIEAYLQANSPQIDNFPRVLPSADGVISDGEKQGVWVASADCTPVLIGDRQTNQVGAIHAGWRGTAKRIVPEAIDKFLNWGSELKDLVIVMGPAISGKVYQVSEEVAVEVGDSFLTNHDFNTPDQILEALHSLDHSPLLPDEEEGKVRLDVRTINWLQLRELGLNIEQIAIAPYCTYQQPDHFFSYRREKEKKVQWSGIVAN
jgi:polyphenol oxidase